MRINAKPAEEVSNLLGGAPDSEVRLYVRGGQAGSPPAQEAAHQDVQGGVDETCLFANKGAERISPAAPGGPLPSEARAEAQADMTSAYIPPPAYPHKPGCAVQ